jgi:16S rRNA (cytidine1402-2'-O)-methyltransferase
MEIFEKSSGEAGILYIVATPIGDPLDITLRGLDILQKTNAIICEENRQGIRTLNSLGIKGKEIITLNEHNEHQQSADIVLRLAQGQSMALISDCGTPVFADPGQYLIQKVIEFGLQVKPVPGPSSLMAALSILDIKLDQFIFRGFLPRENDRRKFELKNLQRYRLPVILMDTPYRLARLLEEVCQVFGKKQIITLACDLTQTGEFIFRGTVDDVRKQVAHRKAEFILIIHAAGKRSPNTIVP